MVALEGWNGLLRFVVWMSPPRARSQGAPPASGGGEGRGGGDGDDPERHFEALFKRHFDEVLRYLRRLGASSDLAVDLTQETFLRVYQSIETFRGGSALRTWIFGIAKNLWRNQVRHDQAEGRRGIEVPLPETPESGLDPSGGRRFEGWGIEPGTLEKILEEEGKRRLYDAMAHLPPRMRECMLYRVHQGLKYREIAALMGISIGTVKAQIFQAQAQLRKELGDLFDSFDLRGDGE